MHREKFPGPSIKLLQVRGPPMNDTKTISENWQCKLVDGQNLVPTVQLGLKNHFLSAKVLTTERLPHSAVLDTVTLIHTQILVDLSWLQTVDGVGKERIVCNNALCVTILSADQDFCQAAQIIHVK